MPIQQPTPIFIVTEKSHAQMIGVNCQLQIPNAKKKRSLHISDQVRPDVDAENLILICM